MSLKPDYENIAEILTGGHPLDFKAYPDGTLVVIAHDGKKHRFTATQVKDALPKSALEAAPKAKPGPKAKSATMVKPGRQTKSTKNLENKG